MWWAATAVFSGFVGFVLVAMGFLYSLLDNPELQEEMEPLPREDGRLHYANTTSTGRQHWGAPLMYIVGGILLLATSVFVFCCRL